MAFRPFIAAFVWFLLLLQVAGAGSPTDKINRLLSNSPFGQSRAGAAGGGATGDPLEFRGVLEENGNKLFSIYETGTHHSTWVELNDSVNGFSVKSYNPANETLSVEYQDRPLTLAIKRAAPVAQAAQFQAPPGVMAPTPANPTGQVGQSPVDQQRLQQIQEEIRRRRALRQQASPTSGPTNSEGGPQPGLPSPSTLPPGPQPGTPSPSNLPSGPQPMPLRP